MSEKPRKRAVIYARYSSDNQRTESIDEQVRACKYYAQHSGQYDIVGVYKDEALSGYRNIHKRDGFTRLIADAEAHSFEAVIVYELPLPSVFDNGVVIIAFAVVVRASK